MECKLCANRLACACVKNHISVVTNCINIHTHTRYLSLSTKVSGWVGGWVCSHQSSPAHSAGAGGRAGRVVDGPAPRGHVALAPCAVHAGNEPSPSRLRVVVAIGRLLRERHEPPVGVEFGVGGRGGRGRGQVEGLVGEAQRLFPSVVDSVDLRACLRETPLTLAAVATRPSGGGAGQWWA